MLPSAPPPVLSIQHTKTTRADRGDNSLLSARDMKIRYSSKFDSDRIAVVLDSFAEDWHIDAEPGYDSAQMSALLDSRPLLGYEPLSDDECAAEILPSGGVRIYLVPVGV